MDAGAGGLLGAAQPRGHGGVVQLLDDPQPNGVAFGAGELGERPAERGAPLRGVDQLLDPLDRGVVQRRDRDRQPPAGAQSTCWRRR
jgi:hypothetical protein